MVCHTGAFQAKDSTDKRWAFLQKSTAQIAVDSNKSEHFLTVLKAPRTCICKPAGLGRMRSTSCTGKRLKRNASAEFGMLLTLLRIILLLVGLSVDSGLNELRKL